MAKPLELLERQIVGIRLGTISPAVVDSVKVLYQGSMTPINHLAFSQPTKGGIAVNPYDPQMVGAIVTALKSSGMNAYAFSKTSVMVSVPPITGEAKDQIRGHLKKLGEEAKIAIRNIRKKARQKMDGLPKDELQKAEKELQKLTDDHISEIDRIVNAKAASL